MTVKPFIEFAMSVLPCCLRAVDIYIPETEFSQCTGPYCHSSTPYPSGIWASCLENEVNNANPDSRYATTRDPINLLSGKVTEYAVDLSLPDAAMPLKFERFYVSGIGWRHSFDIKLVVASSSRYISLPNGEKIPFTNVSNDAVSRWCTYRDVDWTLSQSGDFYIVDMGEGANIQFTNVGNLSSVSDPCGNMLQFIYSQSNPITIMRNGRTAFALSYSNGKLVCVNTPDNRYYSQYTYDINGNLCLVKVTVGSNTVETSYQYGQYGLTVKTNAIGDNTYYNYCMDTNSTFCGFATGLTYNNCFYRHLVQYSLQDWTGANGHGSRVEYCRDGECIYHEYAANADRTRMKKIRIIDCGVNGAMSNEYVKTYAIDNNYRHTGKTVKETHYAESGMTTAQEVYSRTYSAEAVGAVSQDTYSYNGATKQYNYSWDTSFRNVIAVNNAYGGSFRYSYSPEGLLKSSCCMFKGRTSDMETYDYDAQGLLTQKHNPHGGVTMITRDFLGRPVSVSTPNGVIVDYEYDSLGHLLAASRCGVELFRNTVDVDGKVVRTDYPDSTFTTYLYDAMGRPAKISDASGRTLSLSYSIGNVVTNATFYYTNLNGFLVAHSEATRHDTQLNIREIHDAKSCVAEAYSLDALDRVVAITNAEGQVARMAYDIGSRVSGITRFDGSNVFFSWNAYGLKSIAYSSFTNDYVRLMDGTPSKITGANGVISYQYDQFGNRTNMVTAQGSVEYGYVGTSDVANRSFGGNTVSYSYDIAGRMTNAVWQVADLTLPFQFGYSLTNGALTSVTYPNGVVSAFTYDVMDRLSCLNWSGYVSSTVDSRKYFYNEVGNIASIQTDEYCVSDYIYDGYGRLIGETVYSSIGETSCSVAQVYDENGNKTARSVVENGTTECQFGTFSPGNRLVEWKSTTIANVNCIATNTFYSYADSGCTTGSVSYFSDGTSRTVKYLWTDDYRLSEVCENGETMVRYKYDALGNLIAVSHGEKTFNILVDGGHPLADVSDEGITLRVYMRGTGIDNWLGFVDLATGQPIPYFYVTDHLGSVLAVTDASGTVVERYEYDAWGNLLAVTDMNGQFIARSSIGNRILWQGREYDWETGLYYFRSRWYDPSIGRWISKDPVGICGGLNLYEYCMGDPINERDVTGLDMFYDSGSYGERQGSSSFIDGHSTLFVENHRNGGYVSFDFGPRTGGRNDMNINVFYGPSSTSIRKWPLPIPSSSVRIATTESQDYMALEIMQILDQLKMPYDVGFNNCAHMVRRILRKAGINIPNRRFDTPVLLEKDLKEISK